MRKKETHKKRARRRWYLYARDNQIIPIQKLDIIFSLYNSIFYAPDLKDICRFIEVVNREYCIGNTPVDEILAKTGQWCTFRIGDPLEFKGKVIGRVKIEHKNHKYFGYRDYIEIMISEKYNVYFYCRIREDGIICPFIELVS